MFNLFKRPSKTESTTMQIGLPTNVVHGVHVSKNILTGDLEGLPKTWIRMLDDQVTQDEQHENPDAAYQAVKFYNYSIKKKENVEPFKPFFTEAIINEESEEIDKFLNSKNAQKSDDSLSDKSKEENNVTTTPPPPLPKKTMSQQPKPPIMPKPISLANHKSVYKKIEDLRITHNVDHNNKILEEDDLILRPKEQNTRVSLFFFAISFQTLYCQMKIQMP
jgi:p21-activated kinase 1